MNAEVNEIPGSGAAVAAPASPCAGARKDHEARLVALFAAGCRLPAAERPQFLEQACLGNAALRAELESLLAQDACASRQGFLSPEKGTALVNAKGPDPFQD